MKCSLRSIDLYRGDAAVSSSGAGRTHRIRTVLRSRTPGLGTSFRDAERTALRRIVEHPEIGLARRGTRRLSVDGFPYHIVYRVAPVDVEVLAVAHRGGGPGTGSGGYDA